MDVIEGSLGRLKPMTRDDLDMFLYWVNSPAASPFWYGRERTITRDDILGDWEAFYFEDGEPVKGRAFVIEVEGEQVGMICYTDTSENIDRLPVQAEIDIVIGAEENQNQGYGTDAIRAMLHFLFEVMGFHRVHVGTYRHNERMRHTLEKIGFTFEGVSRESDLVDGRYVDAFNYGILAGEPF